MSILASKDLPPFIKILVTSRDESDICQTFSGKPRVIEKPLHIDLDTSGDVSKYLHHRFQEMTSTMMDDEPWPTDDAFDKLEQHAGGLFIWASTVCNFIEGDGRMINHQAKLELILNKTSSDPESALDKLYSAVLEESYSPQDGVVQHDFNLILSTMVTAQSPLSSMAITQFLVYMQRKSAIKVITFVQPLGSLLSGTRDPNVQLQPLHPSFYDFLTNTKRSGPFYIDQQLHNTSMAVACLEIIIHDLNKDDPCGVGDPFYQNKDISNDVIEKVLSEAVHYACHHLKDHIDNVDSATVILANKIRTFLCEHLLHWIEALSLMNMLGIAHPSLVSLEQWLKVSSFILD